MFWSEKTGFKIGKSPDLITNFTETYIQDTEMASPSLTTPPDYLLPLRYVLMITATLILEHTLHG